MQKGVYCKTLLEKKKSDTQNRLQKQQRLIQCIKVIICPDTMVCKLVQSKRLRTDATDNTHHTNTDDTCGSRTLHDVHARLTRRFCFGPVRGCKHTWWVQALVMEVDIAIALTGVLLDGCYGSVGGY